ncbi:hypothetical protein BC937DRAFT_90517 [Endogone sp. FLAS-F59071]|nr:hypothetical protein BC937DRAFT_90517 [Endogone sp. FLAS-F59071]|eukprot:RUS17028.1 hypothetical protein BC937DRAFT_90517 [Endogone sp. FLAS-F59071]
MSILPRVIRAMQRIAPLELSESAWDNVGLLCRFVFELIANSSCDYIEPPFPRQSANKIFLTIDLTPQVLEEAISDPAVGTIIAYHPPIFKAMKRLTIQDTKQAIVMKAIAKGVAIYSPHTAADNSKVRLFCLLCIITLVNDWLAKGLGKGICSPIYPAKNPPEGQEQSGTGRLFTFQETVSLFTVIERIKKLTNLKHVRVATAERHFSAPVSTVGICAGSGSSVLGGVQADIYFTGEMGHHDVLAALAQGTSVVLCEHTNTERGYLRAVLMPRLMSILANEPDAYEQPVEVVCSEIDRDPLVIM